MVRIIFGAVDLSLKIPDAKAAEIISRFIGEAAKISDNSGSTENIEKKNTHSRNDSLFGEGWKEKTEKAERPERQEDGYRGFMLIRCGSCGKLRGFNSKSTISSYICDECKETGELKDLVPAYVDCPNCGKHFKYMTNVGTEETISYTCLNCESPVDLQYVEQKKSFQTIC